jgi:pyruvate dehydrogenase complex dehydrogenase (E1) component
MRNIAPRDGSEIEALEQREWLESLEYVIDQGDRGRVQRLLARYSSSNESSRRFYGSCTISPF